MATACWARGFDVLRLVDDQVRPVSLREELLVHPRDDVGGEHDLVRLFAVFEVLKRLCSPAPVVTDDVERGAELLQLALPVAEDRGRADEEGRAVGVPGAGRLLMEQRGDDLDRLAEAHVVGQAGAEAHVGHVGEPREPARLVGAQLADEGLGVERGLDRVALKERVDEALDVALCDDLDLAGAGDHRAGERGGERRGAVHVAGRLGAFEEALHLLHRARVDGHPLAAPLHERLLESRDLAELFGREVVFAERDLPAEAREPRACRPAKAVSPLPTARLREASGGAAAAPSERSSLGIRTPRPNW